MGLVCDIHWSCPGCSHRNYSQAYCYGSSPDEGFQSNAVPLFYASKLKWNEPCQKCGEYKLKEQSLDNIVNMNFERIEHDPE